MGSNARIPTVRPDDWVNLNRVLRKLSFSVFGADSSPTFSGLTLTGLTKTRVIFAGTDGLLTDDADLTFVTDTLHATNVTSTGTITGGTLTDGTTSISGGNYTGVGTITGSDVDISAGTGDYTSTGDGTFEDITVNGELTIPGVTVGPMDDAVLNFGLGSFESNFNFIGDSTLQTGFTVKSTNFANEFSLLLSTSKASFSASKGIGFAANDADIVFERIGGKKISLTTPRTETIGDIVIKGDNTNLKIGATSTDLQLFSDGTNGIITVATELRLGQPTVTYTVITTNGTINQFGAATATLNSLALNGDLDMNQNDIVNADEITANEYHGASDIHFKENGAFYGVNDNAKIHIGETSEGFDAWIFESFDSVNQLLIKSSAGIYVEALDDDLNIVTGGVAWNSSGNYNLAQWGENGITFFNDVPDTEAEMDFTLYDINHDEGFFYSGFTGNTTLGGSIASATLTHSAVGPTDNLDVTGVNTVFIDCSGGDVIIGGLVGGVDGQVIYFTKLCDSVNNATLEHNEGGGNQDLFLHKGADETLNGEYGGWVFVCNGSNWYDLSHAKHV